MNFPIIITPKACNAFLENLKSDNSENKYVRIFIRGGGCQGMIFSLDLDVKINPEEDLTHEQDGVKFVVDCYSLEFLKGTTIDYNDNLLDSGFKFINNVKRSCGCGKSFSL